MGLLHTGKIIKIQTLNFNYNNINNKNVQIISNLEDGQNFLKSMDTNLRPKVIIFSDKTTPTNSFKMLSSQFRGEIDFAFAYHHDHDIRLV